MSEQGYIRADEIAAGTITSNQILTHQLTFDFLFNEYLAFASVGVWNRRSMKAAR